jgi:hypothetical protein
MMRYGRRRAFVGAGSIRDRCGGRRPRTRISRSKAVLTPDTVGLGLGPRWVGGLGGAFRMRGHPANNGKRRCSTDVVLCVLHCACGRCLECQPNGEGAVNRNLGASHVRRHNHSLNP